MLASDTKSALSDATAFLKDPSLDELSTEVSSIVRETILSQKPSGPLELEKLQDRLRNIEIIIMASSKWAQSRTEEIEKAVSEIRQYIFSKLTGFLLENTTQNENDKTFAIKILQQQKKQINETCSMSLIEDKNLFKKLDLIEFFMANVEDEITPERKFISFVLSGKEALKMLGLQYNELSDGKEEEFVQLLR